MAVRPPRTGRESLSLHDAVADVLSVVDEAFSSAPRPAMFIRGTCSCEECTEHEADMQRFERLELSIDDLGNPAWDPVCFASNDAWTYLMPGLIRLVLAHTDDYITQFSFHVGQPERLNSLSERHARALSTVLGYLLLHEPRTVENNGLTDELMQTYDLLQRIGAGG
jgi:hypothetical protein